MLLRALLPALCLVTTPDEVQGTIWSALDRTWVSHMQANKFSSFTIFAASNPDLLNEQRLIFP